MANGNGVAGLATSPATYSAAGSGVALLGDVIEWASSWPLKPPTGDQANAMAALLLAVVASMHAWMISRRNGKDAPPAATPDPVKANA